ncbi:MAG: hypothetical protein EBT07_08655 [Actinobacteria bacterium]|nr:hypothetical protein [Actinomycetota bacterium]
MEPSLRSSTQRGNECKLRKPEQAVHETVRRFVESLRTDVRISQYADLVYAGKKIEENNSPWYWLEPVPGGRTGFLVFLPGQQAVWTDEQGKVSFFVQVRVAEEIYKKNSVFIASLNKFDGLLRLEDAWLIAGQNQSKTPFTQRWDSLIRFYSTQYKEDFQLQQGLRIELASFQSLANLDKWDKIPVMMFLQGENAHKRLRVQLEETAPVYAPAQQQQQPRPPQMRKMPTEPVKQRAMFVDEDEPPTSTESQSDSTANAVAHKESIAKAVAHEEYPDTYNLWIKGVKKGYAAVQDLDLSRELRLASQTAKDLFVKVEWNSEFNMYEIVSKA